MDFRWLAYVRKNFTGKFSTREKCQQGLTIDEMMVEKHKWYEIKLQKFFKGGHNRKTLGKIFYISLKVMSTQLGNKNWLGR